MPYLHHGRLVPGDPEFGTRWASEQEKQTAGRALMELDEQRNEIALVPAPEPHFDGHKIRVQVASNPNWYRDFGSAFWKSKRSFQLKRLRVEKALKRVHQKGIVRRNGYERLLLPLLIEYFGEGRG